MGKIANNSTGQRLGAKQSLFIVQHIVIIYLVGDKSVFGKHYGTGGNPGEEEDKPLFFRHLRHLINPCFKTFGQQMLGGIYRKRIKMEGIKARGG